MKTIDIALKDLTRSFRSLFALVFMFGVPLLMTGMFYLMFGNLKEDDAGFNLPRTRVVIANLDAPAAGETSAGEIIVQVLQDAQFAELLDVSIVPDAASARQAVDAQQAGVAIIIPPDFSAIFGPVEADAAVTLYQDPTLTIGPRIVRDILSQILDGFAATRIAVSLAVEMLPPSSAPSPSDYAMIGQVAQAYQAASPQGNPAETLLETRPLTAAQSPGAESPSVDFVLQIVGPIMGGMLIFYAFFTGTSAASSLLKENEEGTLPRLFTTPTRHSAILGGKFLAVGLTVIVQVTVLFVASRLIFGIRWGAALPVALAAVGAMCVATTAGIFVNALIKNTQQGGLIYGGVLTVTGMLGMMPIFTGGLPNTPAALGVVSLIVPQGWALRGLLLAMSDAPLADVFINLLVLLAWSAIFFGVGVWRFQKRYA